MAPTPDPRTHITPASFAVAPELLGTPLAGPWRRAVAMGIDLLLIALLVNAGGVLLALAAAGVLLWASSREKRGRRRPWVRNFIRFGAAFVVFAVIVSNWGRWRRDRAEEDAASAVDEATQGQSVPGVNLTGLGAIGAVGDALALKKADTEREAQRAADRLVERLKRSGMSADQMADARAELLQQDGSGLPPRAVAALRRAFAERAGIAPDTGMAAGAAGARDSLARRYVARLEARDTAAASALAPRLGSAFAAESLSLLRGRTARLERSNAALEKQLDAEKQKPKGVGLVNTLADMGAEVARLLRKAGLGFGLTGLYFTAFLALMNGQTPGKKLMGMRVRRLDGEPMGWWASFERFGGYSASIITGLGGFFQILWDRNRQGLHDKIAETVVVRL